MADDRDLLQRQAERPVQVPRVFRVALGAVVLLGAALFVAFGGLLLFGLDRSRMPHPDAAPPVALLIVALGLAFGYVGARLVLTRRDADHLMTARATRVASWCTAAVGVLTAASGALMADLDFVIAGLSAVVMAFWLHASAKRIGRTGP